MKPVVAEEAPDKGYKSIVYWAAPTYFGLVEPTRDDNSTASLVRDHGPGLSYVVRAVETVGNDRAFGESSRVRIICYKQPGRELRLQRTTLSLARILPGNGRPLGDQPSASAPACGAPLNDGDTRGFGTELPFPTGWTRSTPIDAATDDKHRPYPDHPL